MAIIQSNCWTDALKNCTEQTDTPMRRLIRKMPGLHKSCTLVHFMISVLDNELSF